MLPPHSERLEWKLVRFAKQRTLSQIWDRPVIIRNRIYLVQFETTTSFFLRFRSRQIAYAYSLRTWLPMARAPIHLSASRVIFWVCVLPTACFLYAFQTCWCKPNMIVTSCMKLCGYLCAVDAKNEPISTMCLECWNSNLIIDMASNASILNPKSAKALQGLDCDLPIGSTTITYHVEFIARL